ncbi:MAG: phospholipase [Polyangiaceae bacterium]|nr:phospholipase [Polyangiaceae bacterium]
METIKLGNLDAVVLEPQSQAKQNIVLLHGFGAPGTDLVGLAEVLPRENQRYIFLQAPHVLDGMGGPMAGRAWWLIDMVALQVARMTRQFDQLAAEVPDGLQEAQQGLIEAYRAIQERYTSADEGIILGGFSQGAMLACQTALTAELQLQGLVLLSGTVICEKVWKAALAKPLSFPVFQSHSPQDEVLPYELAERLCELFRAGGSNVDFVPFRGGHGIGPEVIQGLAAFLLQAADSSGTET